MAPTTTTAAPQPDSTVVLVFKLEQEFDPDLENKNSNAFITLARGIEQALNTIFSNRFRSRFRRAIVRSFRRGSVVVDSELEFNNATSVPESTDVETTLVNAYNTSNFNYTLNTTSVVASRMQITTLSPTTSVYMTSTVNPTTPTVNITSPNVIPSTPAVTETSTSTITSTSVATNTPPTTVTNVTSTATIPASTNPTATPAEATTASSTATTLQTATTLVTDPPTSTEGTLTLSFRLARNFQADYAVKSSAAFQALALEVLTEVNRIGKRLNPSSFRRSIINSFTSGSVVVDTTLVYTNQTSVPDVTTANQQFQTELENSTLVVVNGSVVLESTVTPTTTSTPTTDSTFTPTSTSTSGPVTSSVPSTTVNEPSTTDTNRTTPVTTIPPVQPSTATSGAPVPTTTNPPTKPVTTQSTLATTTTVTTAPPTAPPTGNERALNVSFRLLDTFTSDLEDRTSPKFQKLADLVIIQVNIACRRIYGFLFLRSFVIAFRSGSVVTQMGLVFRDKRIYGFLFLRSFVIAFRSGSVVTQMGLVFIDNSSIPTLSNATTELNAELTSSKTGLNISDGSVNATTYNYSNTSSEKFKALALEVLTEINSIGKRLNPSSFKRSIINSFTSGSTVVNMTLVYTDKATVPDVTTTSRLFQTELEKSSLNIVNGSVVVESTTTSSSPPGPTMGTLTFFSLTMLAVAQMLISS
ncbi:hypothetical protein OJAV_G00006940 [Oryzias javanicus]|uniref:SEA domain-containing protein n=1 Tax=Oryzias javanicus TaxID=123683 RepID=A0A437DMN3_ORYJA|nr:hypothetical protein OJAV_G00006940 [Oryzias javanicus]